MFSLANKFDADVPTGFGVATGNMVDSPSARAGTSAGVQAGLESADRKFSTALPGSMNTSASVRAIDGVASLGEKMLSLNDFRQLLQAFTAKSQLDEVKDMLGSMQYQIHSLQQQLGQLQRSLNVSPSTLEKMKEDVFGRPHQPQDNSMCPPTPHKITPGSQQLFRQDFTPSEDAQRLKNQCFENGNTVSTILKRSLKFPTSLEELLEKRKGTEYGSYMRRDAAIQTDDEQPPTCPPPFSLADIKQEVSDDAGNGSSTGCQQDPKRKTGLLMLAHVALQSNKKLLADESLPDSGRSSGSSCSGSPCSFKTDNQKRSRGSLSVKGTYRVVKRSSDDTKLSIVVPKKSKSNSASVAEQNKLERRSSGGSDVKSITRKRRKEKQPLPCDFCGKLFNNQSSLRQHESFHRPVRPFVCDHEKCDKAYKTRSELNRHVIVHSGEKRHLCKLCGKRFLRKQYLKTHLLRHHETGITMVTPSSKVWQEGTQENNPMTVVPSSFVNQTEPLTYRCRLCLKIFVNHEDLERHSKSYHERRRSGISKSRHPLAVKENEKYSSSAAGSGNGSSTETDSDDQSDEVQPTTTGITSSPAKAVVDEGKESLAQTADEDKSSNQTATTNDKSANQAGVQESTKIDEVQRSPTPTFEMKLVTP